MIDAAEPDDAAAWQPLPNLDRDLAQIRVRRSETAAVVDRHRQHLGNRPGEGDRSTVRGSDRGPLRNGEVETPVPAVSPHWGEGADDLSVYWRSKTGADARRYEQNGNQDKDHLQPCHSRAKHAIASGLEVEEV